MLPSSRYKTKFSDLVLYPEEGSIAKTSVRYDSLNDSISITIYKLTSSNYAAQDFLPLLHQPAVQ